MAELMTQAQMEHAMYTGGVNRAETMIAKAEDKGRAHQNPYASRLFGLYVLPLAAAIRATHRDGIAGSHRAFVKLLESLDAGAVAFIAIRTVLNLLLDCRQPNTDRSVAYQIGKFINSELVLLQIEDSAPELYHTLVNDLGRRLSKDERHRMTVFKMQAAKRGINWTEWPIGARDQVGLFLLSLMQDLGLIEVIEGTGRRAFARGLKTPPKRVFLSEAVMAQITEVKGFVAISSPMYGPCVEPPLDWTTPNDGGFHTHNLRRTHRNLVRATAATRGLYREAVMPKVLRAVNGLQRTAWAVNGALLDTILAVGATNSKGEIVLTADSGPRPAPPTWVTPETDTKTLDGDRLVEWKAWKRRMAEWYTQRKLRSTRFARFYSATRAAEYLRDYPAIYFVYFADSRGRLYPMTYGLNPQGSDLQKALIHAAHGKPLATPDAVKWFLVHGANKFGFDKAPLAERMAWVRERHDLIMAMGTDPQNNLGWMDADKPLQFLAWCMEYTAWMVQPEGFVSRLPISMDGSCNGLQHLSALLRDEIGGAATNLIPAKEMADVYGLVAAKAYERMKKGSDKVDADLMQRWLEHGISRKAVKRAVMCTPYGVTRTSATEYVIEDYLKDEHVKHPFQPQEYGQAALTLMHFVWPAIGDVIVKGREAMAWLRSSATKIVKAMPVEQDGLITWETPSGFPAAQAYYEVDIHRIHTNLFNTLRVRVLTESDDPSRNKHASGMAPNFVHSMDAAHLHLTTVAALDHGIDFLAMIHDDYGTLAADAEVLFRLIRQQFVAMYQSHDPLAAFHARYPQTAAPPAKGELDVARVLLSDYFFS